MTPVSPAPIARDEVGERRQLTVLFADLVGATALSHRLDPEAFRAVLDLYQNACAGAVSRFGGQIKQFLGDGVLAYFGFPMAHENDAERAVRAGLAIVRSVGALQGSSGASLAVQVRVGIHTGIVVVGEINAQPDQGSFAFGDVPNVAARVQGEAAPDTVCIGRPTLNLLAGRFETRSLGFRPLKGLDGKVELFEVAGEAASAGIASGGALPLLVGREVESRMLVERWTAARNGAGQAVMIAGEAGLGKSRLVDEFRRQTGDDVAWRDLRGTPYTENSAFQPVIDAFLAQVDHRVDRGSGIRALLAEADRVDDTTVGLVSDLLGVVDGPPIGDLSPQQRRRRLIDALVAWIVAPARTRPTVVAFEDVHWLDASTIELIGELIDRLVPIPILVLMTFRSEFVPQWKSRAHLSTITLAKLSDDDTATIVRTISGGKALPPALTDEIVRRCDGVPLFVEEITKTVLEAGRLVENATSFELAATSSSAFDVPATLRDSLTARLDRLGPAKGTAQLAAVLGREFDYAVLQAVSGLSDAVLEDRLDTLMRADIVQPGGLSSRDRYAFRHALIQEAAYGTLLRSTRQAHHARIARTYVDRFVDVARTRPELVARHFEQAADPASAGSWWLQAIELANARQGYREAIAHFEEALGHAPGSPEVMCATDELALRLAIGPAMMVVFGFSDERVGVNYARASEVACASGRPAERFAATWGDWLHNNSIGRVFEAAKRSDTLVALGRELTDPGFALQAHHSRWTNGVFLGRITEAMEDTQRGIDLYDPVRHAHHKHSFGGHDPGVCALNFGALSAWQSGLCDEASRRIDAGLALSLEIDHALTTASTYFHGAMLAHLQGRREVVAERAARLTALSQQAGIGQWLGMSRVCAGATVDGAHGSVGLETIEEGLKDHAARGPRGISMLLAAIAAETYLRFGNRARALALLDDASVLGQRTGFGLHRPEVERLRTQLRLEEGLLTPDEAVAAWFEAAAMARTQGATTLLARIAASLAPLVGGGSRAGEYGALIGDLLASPAAPGETPDVATLRAANCPG